MSNTISTLAALGATYAGMSGHCLAMERHFNDAFALEPSAVQQRKLRVVAWTLLALALLYSIRAWGDVIGPFGFIGILTLTTLVLVFLFTYHTKLALYLGGVSFAVFLIASVTSLITGQR